MSKEERLTAKGAERARERCACERVGGDKTAREEYVRKRLGTWCGLTDEGDMTLVLSGGGEGGCMKMPWRSSRKLRTVMRRCRVRLGKDRGRLHHQVEQRSCHVRIGWRPDAPRRGTVGMGHGGPWVNWA